jgi:hypothetical protein
MSGHSWEINSRSASQEIPIMLRNPKVHYRAVDIQPIFFLYPDVSYHLWSYERYCIRNRVTYLSLKIHARNLRWKAEADLSCYLVILMEAIINIYLFIYLSLLEILNLCLLNHEWSEKS